jgi:hypothetical protein
MWCTGGHQHAGALDWGAQSGARGALGGSPEGQADARHHGGQQRDPGTDTDAASQRPAVQSGACVILWQALRARSPRLVGDPRLIARSQAWLTGHAPHLHARLQPRSWGSSYLQGEQGRVNSRQDPGTPPPATQGAHSTCHLRYAINVNRVARHRLELWRRRLVRAPVLGRALQPAMRASETSHSCSAQYATGAPGNRHLQCQLCLELSPRPSYLLQRPGTRKTRAYISGSSRAINRAPGLTFLDCAASLISAVQHRRKGRKQRRASVAGSKDQQQGQLLNNGKLGSRGCRDAADPTPGSAGLAGRHCGGQGSTPALPALLAGWPHHCVSSHSYMFANGLHPKSGASPTDPAIKAAEHEPHES